MPLVKSTTIWATIALAALASGAHALSKPMSAADADTLVAKLAGYTAMYESLVPQVLAKYLNIDGTKGTSGVPYCSKVSEGFAAYTGTDPDKADKCDDMPDNWRLAEAQKYKSDATSGDCCPECLMGTDTNEYKARCTVDGFVGATVCGTNGTIGQESDFDVYMPGPPIAWKTAPVDCSTGPEHEVRFCFCMLRPPPPKVFFLSARSPHL